MSSEASYSYELERARQREIYLNRIRENTMSFYERFKDTYESMVSQGLREYIPNEISRVESYLDRIRENLEANPEAARDYSMELGSFIMTTKHLGIAVRKEMEQKERMRLIELKEKRKEEKSKLMGYFYEQMNEFDDPVIRDFAVDELNQLKNKINDMERSRSIEEIKTEIMKQIKKIYSKAKINADQWKEEKERETEKDANMDLLNTYEETIKEDKRENPNKIEKILKELATRRKELESGKKITKEELNNEISQKLTQTQNAVIEERIRKETVGLIVKSLRETGFVIAEKPKLYKNGEKNYVLISAARPSGKEVKCKIDLSGSFTYRFDNYEGQACKKDIEVFNKRLQDIYGVKLSDEVIIWKNPDKISASAKPSPFDLERRK